MTTPLPRARTRGHALLICRTSSVFPTPAQPMTRMGESDAGASMAAGAAVGVL